MARPNTKKSSKKPPKVNISSEFHSRFLMRSALYVFFASLTLILSFLVYYRARGYTFTKTGQVEKRGILLLDSKPVSAKVLIDKKEVETTKTKLELSEGLHQVQLQAKDYRTWSNSFQMKAETVKWYYYPYLIPNQIPSETYLNSQDENYSSLSSDDRLVSISSSENNLAIELLNLSAPADSAVKTLSIPTDLFSKSTDDSYGSFNFLEWSPDADSLLVEHLYTQGQNQVSEIINIRVNNPEQSTNFTRTLAAPISSAHFDSSSKLNFLIGDELRQYSPVNSSLEGVIATNITSFKSFEDQTYLYTKLNNSSQTELYIQKELERPVLVINLENTPLDQIDYNYLINRRSGYLSLSNKLDKEIQIFKNPLQKSLADGANNSPLYLATFANLNSVNLQASFVGSNQPGRYIALQLDANKFFVYDFDSEESMTYSLQADQTSVKTDLQITKFAWLDQHRLQALDSTGSIYYFDYDGNYLNLITEGAYNLTNFVSSKAYSIVLRNSTAQETKELTKLNFKIR